jgi:putative ABC transport system permease protein
MLHLMRWISLRYLRAAPGRTLLTLFGISLGVCVVFAIDVVNTSVVGSFKNTIDSASGKTALTVGDDGTGVDEALLERVRAVPGVLAAAPVIEETARDLKSGTQLVVLGVDTTADGQVRDYEITANDVKIADDLAFLNDPHAVIVTTRFAERVGVKVGDTLSLESVQGKSDYTIRGTLAAHGPANMFGGDVLLMDVYAAQIAFERGKRFDHIDVVPAADTELTALRNRIDKALSGKASIKRPEGRTAEAEQLMAGFRLGLSLAGLVTMFVGGFIVYNALAIAVGQRRHEIGVLRALGTTRAQILALFVGEGMLMGALGAAVGVGFGMLLARSVLKMVAGTVSALYVTVAPEHLLVSARDVIVAVSVGVGAAFIAAFFPARSAAFVEPASAMRKKSDGADVSFASMGTSLKVGGGALLVALLLALFVHVQHNFLLGYAVSAVFALAAAFLSPALALAVGGLARRLLGDRDPAVMLGSVGFMRNAGRNSVAIAALGMGLANVVNADAFVDSMKHNTTRWLERSTRADIFVFAGKNLRAKVDHPLPESLGQELRKLPDIALVDPNRSTRHSLHGQPFNLISNDLAHYRRYNDIPVVAGDLERALPAMEAGTGLAASETFAHAFQVGLGDKLTLQTPAGPRSFEIVLVYVDYSSELGILRTTHDAYVRIWNDPLADSYGVYVRKGASIDAVRTRVAAAVDARYGLIAISNGEYKSQFMTVIDDSFGLMRATEIVAVVVSVLGIINTLLVTIMDRRTELAVLKAIGAEREQIQRMLMVEGALIGLCATLVGVAFGALFSAYIVKELLRLQVGWQMSWQMSGWSVVETFVVAQAVVLFAVWLPMRAASRVDAVEALQYE